MLKEIVDSKNRTLPEADGPKRRKLSIINKQTESFA